MTLFLQMISLAFYTAFFQNVVFNGGYGVGEALRIGGKPKQLVSFSLFVVLFSSLTAVACRALDLIPLVAQASTALHMLIFVLTLFVIYLLVCIFLSVALHTPASSLKRIGLAAFNTLVLAVPFLNRRAAFSLMESLGAGIGAGLAFFLAALLIGVGVRKIEENDALPKAFRRTPALFLYVSLLSMAFMGFSGTSLFV